VDGFADITGARSSRLNPNKKGRLVKPASFFRSRLERSLAAIVSFTAKPLRRLCLAHFGSPTIAVMQELRPLR